MSSPVRAGRAFVEVGLQSKIKEGVRVIQNDLAAVSRVLGTLGAGLTAMGGAMAAPFAPALIKFAAFDDSMAKLGAITRASTADLETLRQKAKDLGATTKFSASQAADGMVFLGMAGLSTKQTLESIGPVLSLAAAGAMELGQAADIATDVAGAFGIPAAEIGRVADVLAATATRANTDVIMMGEAFKYAAPLAAAAGVPIEDAAAALGILGNNGIKATVAGNDLAGIMKTLAGSAGAAQFNDLGISIATIDGKMRPLVDLMEEFSAATAGMSDVERLSKADQIFGRYAKSALVLSSQAGQLKTMTGAILNSAGAAEEMAATMAQGFGAQFVGLMSGVEAIYIEIGEAVKGTMETVMSIITSAARGVAAFIAENQRLVVGVLASAAGFVSFGGTLLALAGTARLTSIALGTMTAMVDVVGRGVAIASGTIRAANAAIAASFVATRTAITATWAVMTSGTVAAAIVSGVSSAVSVAQAVMTGGWVIVSGATASAWAILSSGGIVSAVVAAASGVIAIAQAAITAGWGVVSGATAAAWSVMSAGGIAAAVVAAASGVVAIAQAVMTKGWAIVGTAAAAAWSIMTAGIAPVAAGVVLLVGAIAGIGAAMAAGSAAVSGLKSAWGPVSKAIGEVIGFVKELFSVLQETMAAGNYREALQVLWASVKFAFWRGTLEVAKAFDSLWSGIWNATKEFFSNFLSNTWRVFASIPNLLKSAISGGTSLGKILSDALAGDGDWGITKALEARVEHARRELQSAGARALQANAEADAASKAKDGDDPTGAERIKAASIAAAISSENVEAAKQRLESLEDEIRVLQMGQDAADRYKLAQQGATEEQLAAVKALQEQRRMLKEREEAKRREEQEAESLKAEGKQLAESLRTPLEVFADEQKRITKLFRSGAIDATTANRALGAARERYTEDTAGAAAPGEGSNTVAMRGTQAVLDTLRRNAGGDGASQLAPENRWAAPLIENARRQLTAAQQMPERLAGLMQRQQQKLIDTRELERIGRGQLSAASSLVQVANRIETNTKPQPLERI